MNQTFELHIRSNVNEMSPAELTTINALLSLKYLCGGKRYFNAIEKALFQPICTLLSICSTKASHDQKCLSLHAQLTL